MKRSKKQKEKSPAAAPQSKRLEPDYSESAKQDRAWWEKHDRPILAKIDALIADIRQHPFTGLGKPEPLRFEWAGWWSRRITGEHRLVYRVEAGVLYIAQCRFHYPTKKPPSP